MVPVRTLLPFLKFFLQNSQFIWEIIINFGKLHHLGSDTSQVSTLLTGTLILEERGFYSERNNSQIDFSLLLKLFYLTKCTFNVICIKKELRTVIFIC